MIHHGLLYLVCRKECLFKIWNSSKRFRKVSHMAMLYGHGQTDMDMTPHTDTRQILKVINVMSDISIHMSKCRCYIGHMWDTEMWSQYTLDQRRKSVQTDFFLWQKLYNINYDGNNISNILRREVKESSTWKNSSKSKENKEAKGQPNAWGSCHYEIQVW